MEINNSAVEDILLDLDRAVREQLNFENLYKYWKKWKFESDILTLELIYSEEPQKEFYELDSIKSKAYQAGEKIFGIFALDYGEDTQISVNQYCEKISIVFKFTIDDLKKAKWIYSSLFNENLKNNTMENLKTFKQFINEGLFSKDIFVKATCNIKSAKELAQKLGDKITVYFPNPEVQYMFDINKLVNHAIEVLNYKVALTYFSPLSLSLEKDEKIPSEISIKDIKNNSKESVGTKRRHYVYFETKDSVEVQKYINAHKQDFNVEFDMQPTKPVNLEEYYVFNEYIRKIKDIDFKDKDNIIKFGKEYESASKDFIEKIVGTEQMFNFFLSKYSFEKDASIDNVCKLLKDNASTIDEATGKKYPYTKKLFDYILKLKK